MISGRISNTTPFPATLIAPSTNARGVLTFPDAYCEAKLSRLAIWLSERFCLSALTSDGLNMLPIEMLVSGEVVSSEAGVLREAFIELNGLKLGAFDSSFSSFSTFETPVSALAVDFFIPKRLKLVFARGTLSDGSSAASTGDCCEASLAGLLSPNREKGFLSGLVFRAVSASSSPSLALLLVPTFPMVGKALPFASDFESVSLFLLSSLPSFFPFALKLTGPVLVGALAGAEKFRFTFLAA
mmetsp:Transcript_5602/g.7899  ORF Transcript_5602/g.7899 Transcript_5602/m.7899 type:complete len:242 (-) Transcript_5602:1626-2351(-)